MILSEKIKKFFFLPALLFSLIFFAFSNEEQLSTEIFEINSEKLPFIKVPDASKDLIFRQFLEEAGFNSKYSVSEKNFSQNQIFTFYKILVPQNMDFIWLSSRLSPVYKDTLATLNRFSSADSRISGKIILAPTFNGIFIPENPDSDWEQLLFKKYMTEEKIKTAKIFKIDGKIFYFLKNERFDSTTALFFLDTKLVSPLSTSVLTSSFGYRVSPISGKWKFHSGIDLAAPLKSSVFACRSGEVSRSGFNPTYGNFVILRHYNNLTSVYAHLSEILVKKGQKVKTGELIAKSGSTGASTGPHLHFELRKDGSPTDPGKIINFN